MANGQPVSMLTDLVETEIIPGRRHQRIDLYFGIGSRAQSDQSADHQIAKRRMVLILAALRGLHRNSFIQAGQGNLPGTRPRGAAAAPERDFQVVSRYERRQPVRQANGRCHAEAA